LLLNKPYKLTEDHVSTYGILNTPKIHMSTKNKTGQIKMVIAN